MRIVKLTDETKNNILEDLLKEVLTATESLKQQLMIFFLNVELTKTRLFLSILKTLIRLTLMLLISL